MAFPIVIRPPQLPFFLTSSQPTIPQKPAFKALDLLLETSHISAINKTVKAAKNTLDLISKVNFDNPSLKHAFSYVSHASEIGDLFGLVSNLKELIKPKEEKIESIRILSKLSLSLGLLSGSMGCAKGLTSLFASTELDKLLVNQLPTLGYLGKPFSVFQNSIQILKGGIEIAISAIKIHGLRTQKLHISNKMKAWKELTPGFINQRYDSLLMKQESCLQEAHLLGSQMLKAQDAVRTAKTLYRLNPLAQLEKNLKDATKKQSAICDALEIKQKRYQVLSSKIAQWKTFVNQKVGNKTIQEIQRLKELKWHQKDKSNNWEIAKEAIGIGLNILMIAVLISAIVLAIISSVSIFLTAGFLTVSLLQLPFHFIKKIHVSPIIPN